MDVQPRPAGRGRLAPPADEAARAVLLNEDGRRLFRCLGVFAGRVALDAIAAVARAVAGAAGVSRSPS